LDELSSYTDEALVNLFKGTRANEAFEELFNRHWEKLLVHAKIKLDNEADAEEVVQQVFINLWNRRTSIQLTHSFYTYIASKFKYEVFNLHSKQQKQKILNLKAKGKLGKISEEDLINERYNYEEKLAILQQELAKLPEKTQIIFLMSRSGEYSGKEIAEKLNVSPKTVEAHITKAIKHLKSSLGEYFYLLF
jgi:RNA polymerase sigma-70 factor (ECF subfamily)